MTNVMTRAPRGGQKQAVPSRKRQWWRWAAGGAGALVVVVVAGLFVYVHYLGGPVPAPLTLPEVAFTSGRRGRRLDRWDVDGWDRVIGWLPRPGGLPRPR